MLNDSVKRIIMQAIEVQARIDQNIEAQIEYSLEKPPNLELGEVSSNISFKLAKKLKKSPIKIAEELSAEINNSLEDQSLIVSSILTSKSIF
jgi:arginyl-tRNA synthetase